MVIGVINNSFSGFDESSVLMLGNMKKTKESEALRATLELPSDSCIDFTQAVSFMLHNII